MRALALAGVHTLVLTNAAGSLRPGLGPGHLLVIRDHIDLAGLAGRSPLVGPNDDRWAGPEGAGPDGARFGDKNRDLGEKGDLYGKKAEIWEEKQEVLGKNQGGLGVKWAFKGQKGQIFV